VGLKSGEWRQKPPARQDLGLEKIENSWKKIIFTLKPMINVINTRSNS
jgi:hypothetical protein